MVEGQEKTQVKKAFGEFSKKLGEKKSSGNPDAGQVNVLLASVLILMITIAVLAATFVYLTTMQDASSKNKLEKSVVCIKNRSDSLCPSACSADNDYDCCTKKGGFESAQGCGYS